MIPQFCAVFLSCQCKPQSLESLSRVSALYSKDWQPAKTILKSWRSSRKVKVFCLMFLIICVLNCSHKGINACLLISGQRAAVQELQNNNTGKSFACFFFASVYSTECNSDLIMSCSLILPQWKKWPFLPPFWHPVKATQNTQMLFIWSSEMSSPTLETTTTQT